MEDNKGIATFLICIAVLCLYGFIASGSRDSFAGEGSRSFGAETEAASDADRKPYRESAE